MSSSSTLVATDQLLLEGKYKYMVPIKCVEWYMKQYDKIKYLYEGENSSVFQICNNKTGDCNFVMKVIIVNDTDQVENEIKITKTMSRHQISPKFYDSWECKGSIREDNKWNEEYIAFIVMEKMDISLNDYLGSYQEKYSRQLDLIQDELITLVTNMYKIGYYDINDFHAGNILVNLDKDKNIIKGSMRLIDFEFASEVENGDPSLDNVLENTLRIL